MTKTEVMPELYQELDEWLGEEFPVLRSQLFKMLDDRAAFGLRKYGVPLLTNNGRDGFKDAWEEAADLCVYLKKLQLEGQEISRCMDLSLDLLVALTQERIDSK